MRNHMANLLVKIARLIYAEAGIKEDVSLQMLTSTVEGIVNLFTSSSTVQTSQSSWVIRPMLGLGEFHVYLLNGQIYIEYRRGDIMLVPETEEDIQWLPLIDTGVLNTLVS